MLTNNSKYSMLQKQKNADYEEAYVWPYSRSRTQGGMLWVRTLGTPSEIGGRFNRDRSSLANFAHVISSDRSTGERKYFLLCFLKI